MSEPHPGRALRRWVAVMAILPLVGLVAGCSDDADTTASGHRDAQHSGSEGTGSGSTSDEAGAGSGAGGSASSEAARRQAEARSHAPSGVAGEVAPNDDDGARNLAAVDPSSGPQAQDTSGSVATDPLASPTPTAPEPGRPDVEGLGVLDWCDDLSAPFYRAVSQLSASSTPEQVRDGVADLTLVVQRAQAPIAAAAQTLLTTAQTAAADAARVPDLGSTTFADAVRTVHVYLGDACGR